MKEEKLEKAIRSAAANIEAEGINVSVEQKEKMKEIFRKLEHGNNHD